MDIGGANGPGCPAAAFRHWRDAGVRLACSGGRRAGPLFAEGDEQPGGKDRARTWQGLAQGEIGIALGPLGDGVVEGLESVQGDTELADEGLDDQGMGGDDARIAGHRRGRFDGLETLGDDVSRAHVVVAEEGLKERAPGEVRRCEGAASDAERHKRPRCLSPETIGAPAEKSFSGSS